MANRCLPVLVALVFLTVGIAGALAANEVTLATIPDVQPGQTAVRVDVYAHNEIGLLEYFNLIEFDATKLAFVAIEADRGSLWYGYYPTHVEGNRVYVHGTTSGGFGDCIDPDTNYPGAALYHLVFDIKSDAAEGWAGLVFLSATPWDGHWNDCGGYPVNPTPDYTNGGIEISSGTSSVVDENPLLSESLSVSATGSGTQVRFHLQQAGSVSVEVYDLRGHRVQQLESGRRDSGWHELLWRDDDLAGHSAPSGVYLVLVKAGRQVARSRVMLIK